MFFVLIPAVAAVVIGVGIRLGIANRDDNPSEWHVDPLTAEPERSPNWFRYSPADAPYDRHPDRDAHPPTFDVGAADLAAAFDATAKDDGAEVLAGSASDGHVTYVVTSKVFEFPDYVSVRFIDGADGGSTLAAYSRARYGQSDLGVNEKRLRRWVDATEQRLT